MESTNITTHITTVNVKDNDKKAFVNWQAKLNTTISAFPGFISIEILCLLDQWTIIQRFSSEDSYQAWKKSDQYRDLFDELSIMLRRDSNAIQEIAIPDVAASSVITEVFVTRINPDKIDAFRSWIAKIHNVEASFPGFRSRYVQSPKGSHDKWITFLQFDTPEHLDFWLNSSERKQVLAEGQSIIDSLESHRVFSPYAGWFGSLKDEGGVIPPVWKQTMLVLLALFPIIMLELRYLPALTGSLPLAIATFIGNAISVTLIAWPMMPILIRYLRWWLECSDRKTNLLGLALLIGLYLAEIIFFLLF